MAMSPEVPERERRTIAIRKVSPGDTTAAAAPAAGLRVVTTASEPTGVAAAPRVAEELPPGSRIGQYELIRRLGRGGMGEVYLARDLRLGRLVAIKFLAEFGAGVTERFLTEARATARCHHENIVMIHDVGEAHEHGGRPYMVLEYVEGQTLGAWWSERAHARHERAGEHCRVSGRRAPLAPCVAVELMIPVVRALAYAHDLGIVHRDLKPTNLMLSSTGAIKVLDFGIAKLLEEAADSASEELARTTQPGSIIGTLPYMSPEQLAGRAVDHRTDIWAVGILMFEMVTGTHPTMSPDGVPLPSALLDMGDLDVPMPGLSERRPDLGPLAGIIDRCLLKKREHRTPSARVLLQELEALAPGRRSVLVSDDGNPFAGLAAFQEGDADRFFGRNRDIVALVSWLRSQPLLAVAGPSGAGKSSLVRAGVIPALKRSGAGWDAVVVRPGRRPLAALADVLLRLSHEATEHRADALPSAPRTRASLCEQLRAAPGQLGAELRTWAQRKQRQVVLFVDQLEELFTLGTEPGEVAAFIACLEGVADHASSPLRVMVAVRSDFIDHLTEHRSFMSEVSRGLWFLSPLDRDGLREALVRPVEDMGHRYEDAGMVESMLDAVAATPGALPLLQFAASKLWSLRDRERRVLTRDSYQVMGGIAGTLASHADTVLAAMTSIRLARARDVLERLVTPERTRAIASIGELRELPGDAYGMEQVIHHLGDARLLVIDGEGDESTVELVHESLIHGWPTLARWLDENQDHAAMLARLRGAARDWERGGQAAGLLWTGEAAAEARAWQQRYRGKLAPAEQRYLEAVRAAAERAHRLRWWLFGAILSVATMVAIALAWLAWEQAEARGQESEAREAAAAAAVAAARETARARDATRMAAMRALPQDPTTQLALLREIEDTTAPPPGAAQEAKRLLHAGVAPVVLTGHEEPVTSARFSPAGRRIVSASYDRTVRVWNADGSGEPLVLRGHDDEVTTAAFSPDGQRIVSGSSDRTLRVWNADGSGAPLVLRGHEDVVRFAAFSPDGQRIVSASVDRTVRVWNADGSGEPLVLQGHQDAVRSVGFSPDGRRIVSGSSDKTVRVWNEDGAGEPLVLSGHDDVILSVAFSLDGQRIVSASADRTVRVWNDDGVGEPLVLRGHDKNAESAAFSPDGRRIVAATAGRTVQVWSADGSGAPLLLRGHEDAVRSAAFSPDGQRVVSASWDGTVRVWSADGHGEPLALRGHEDMVESAAFSPDGLRIVSASRDRTVRVWSADGRGAPLVLRGHDDKVGSAAFSPDGQQIVSASWDKSVRVWSADGRAEPLVLRGHDDWVSGAEFSPDGRYIVSASVDKTIRIWRADGTGEPVILSGHDLWVNNARFSPDGRRIVSASDDHTVRVWHDLAAATLDDPRLWTATTYCMPVHRRKELLGVSEQTALDDLQRCLERVERARGGTAPRSLP